MGEVIYNTLEFFLMEKYEKQKNCKIQKLYVVYRSCRKTQNV